jgi:hypothetical protein
MYRIRNTNQLEASPEMSGGDEVASNSAEKRKISLNYFGILGVKGRQFGYVFQKLFFVDEIKIIAEPPTVPSVVVDEEIVLVFRGQGLVQGEKRIVFCRDREKTVREGGIAL